MPPTPYIEPLSRKKRQLIFIATVSTFVVLVPLLVFYAIGYRFDFGAVDQNIRTVGGLYVNTDAPDAQIFIDDAPVDDMRVFQQAAYIQNITEGKHQVHVQGEGLATWVKELPVFSHYVTEVRSFNLPVTPQVRVIGEWLTPDGATVMFEPIASTTFAQASTSNVFFVATSSATSTYVENSEYAFIQSRFASSSELERIRESLRLRTEQPFLFAADLPPVATGTIATTTKRNRDMDLYEVGEEVFVQYVGAPSSIPHYFCVQSDDVDTIAELYGQHVADSFETLAAATTSVRTFVKGQQWCRDTIRIDRQWESVDWFDFHPQLPDVVLIKSASGLYGVEIDDRAWQNRQLLYAGNDFRTVIDGSALYVEDDGYLLEVLSELIE